MHTQYAASVLVTRFLPRISLYIKLQCHWHRSPAVAVTAALLGGFEDTRSEGHKFPHCHTNRRVFLQRSYRSLPLISSHQDENAPGRKGCHPATKHKQFNYILAQITSWGINNVSMPLHSEDTHQVLLVLNRFIPT